MSQLVEFRENYDPVPAEACAPCDLGDGVRQWTQWCHNVAAARVRQLGGVAAWRMLVTKAALSMTFLYTTMYRQLGQEPQFTYVLKSRGSPFGAHVDS